MNKKERIDYVRGGLKAYDGLNDQSKARTSKAAWIALKLGCSEKQAAKYVAEAEAGEDANVGQKPFMLKDGESKVITLKPAGGGVEANEILANSLTPDEAQLCYNGLGCWLSDYNDAPVGKINKLKQKLLTMGAKP